MLSPLDRFLVRCDQALKTVSSALPSAHASPGDKAAETRLSAQQIRHIAGLMRINHTGEVCAQALYQGQALTARSHLTQIAMQQAAQEESDHLAWCQQRLAEFNEQPSQLNPLWYALSFTLGAAAGLVGDRWSLGFVVETENQVCAHLDSHLKQIPHEDQKTRKILHQMRQDEAHHATTALQAGAIQLPFIAKILMKGMSKLMTMTSYRL